METTRTVPVGYTNTDTQAMDRINPADVRATGENAEPTSRLLDGSSDHGYAEEWQEPATMPDGRACYRMYLFTADDIVDADGEPLDAEDYPWDNAHVRRIRLID